MSAVNVKTEKSCGKDSKKKIAEEKVYVRADMFVLVKTNCILYMPRNVTCTDILRNTDGQALISIANIHSICVNAILFFMRVCSSLKADCIISSSLERILWVYVFVLNLCLRARGPEVGKREGSENGRKGRS